MAFKVVKAMQAEGLDWGEGYRPLGRRIKKQLTIADRAHYGRADEEVEVADELPTVSEL